jgi:hypothetical protein
MPAGRELEMPFEQGSRGAELGQNFVFGHGRTPVKTSGKALDCACGMEACIIFSLEALEALGKHR